MHLFKLAGSRFFLGRCMIMTILRSYILISSVTSWFAAQFIKVFIGAYQTRKRNVIKLIISSGGMPSSHSAVVSALSTASFREYGIASFQFSISVVLALIVIQDAVGVRNQVGKQAKIINEMSEGSITNLKELVGHTPFQVCVGTLLGIAIAASLWYVI